MKSIDERILQRLRYLKENKWPKNLKAAASEIDLSNGRIPEEDVRTIDEFEQCWGDLYHTSPQYKFLDHLIAGSVAFQLRQIAKSERIAEIPMDRVEPEDVLKSVHNGMRYAMDAGDISGYGELLYE